MLKQISGLRAHLYVPRHRYKPPIPEGFLHSRTPPEEGLRKLAHQRGAIGPVRHKAFPGLVYKKWSTAAPDLRPSENRQLKFEHAREVDMHTGPPATQAHGDRHLTVPVPAISSARRRRSWPISRVLSKTIIHLGCVSPRTSSDLPGSTCGPHVRPGSEDPCRLPPYLVLLQAGFALPPSVTTGAVRSYRTISPLPGCACAQPGGLFSVALSVGSRPPGVTWRLALGARTFLHACAQRLPGRLRT